jgi:hypothetical protein
MARNARANNGKTTCNENYYSPKQILAVPSNNSTHPYSVSWLVFSNQFDVVD